MNYSNVGIKMPEIVGPDQRALKIQISCSSLFDVLAVQLLMAIREARQLLVCEKCGDLFGSAAPGTRRKNLLCRLSEPRSPGRYAATDLRMRKARTLALFREGKQVEEIARRVKSKRETIQRSREDRRDIRSEEGNQMKKKRGRGEGSIFRRKDGRWSSVLSIGSGNGRRKRKTFYGPTDPDVRTRSPRQKMTCGLASLFHSIASRSRNSSIAGLRSL